MMPGVKRMVKVSCARLVPEPIVVWRLRPKLQFDISQPPGAGLCSRRPATAHRAAIRTWFCWQSSCACVQRPSTRLEWNPPPDRGYEVSISGSSRPSGVVPCNRFLMPANGPNVRLWLEAAVEALPQVGPLIPERRHRRALLRRSTRRRQHSMAKRGNQIAVTLCTIRSRRPSIGRTGLATLAGGSVPVALAIARSLNRPL